MEWQSTCTYVCDRLVSLRNCPQWVCAIAMAVLCVFFYLQYCVNVPLAMSGVLIANEG